LEARKIKLCHHERQKATYTKRKVQYWDDDINTARQKRSKLTRRTQDDDDIDNEEYSSNQNDQTALYKSMSVKELRKVVVEKRGKVKGIAKFQKAALIELVIHQ